MPTPDELTDEEQAVLDRMADAIEEWKLRQPLTKEEEAEIPPGMTERVWKRILQKIREKESGTTGQ